MNKSIFISFEGIDGSGKTTQAHDLHRWMLQAGIPSELVREPGSTELGEHLRSYLKSRKPITPRAELLMFQAARAQLVETVIVPALKAGTSVIADRYTDSSIAYQGWGRQLPIGAITYLNTFSTDLTIPDITFILTISPWEGRARTTDSANRFEDQNIPFYQRVAQGYQYQADHNPQRVHALDANLSKEELAEQIQTRVLRILTPDNQKET